MRQALPDEARGPDRDGRAATLGSDRALATGWPSRPFVPSSWGDAFDRLTILQIKTTRLEGALKANAERELAALETAIGPLERFPSGLHAHLRELARINGELWDIEDGTRACERSQRFDAAFVALACSVYRGNDERARIKRDIDRLLGSDLVGEKSYVTLG